MENNIGMDWNSNTMVNGSEKSPLVETYLQFFTFSQKTWLDGWFQGYLKGKGKGCIGNRCLKTMKPKKKKIKTWQLHTIVYMINYQITSFKT